MESGLGLTSNFPLIIAVILHNVCIASFLSVNGESSHLPTKVVWKLELMDVWRLWPTAGVQWMSAIVGHRLWRDSLE